MKKNINQVPFSQLEGVISKYSYFQCGWAIYLKQLKQNKSLKYPFVLKKIAIITQDRECLFEFINDIKKTVSRKIVFKKPTKKLVKKNIDVQPVKVNLKEKPLKENIKERKSIDFKLDSKKIIYKKPIENKAKDQICSKKSLVDWVKLIDNSENFIENNTKKKELIDSFLNTPQSIKRIIPKTESVEIASKFNISNQKASKQIGLITETLAKIYMEQQKYKMATEAYKILMLKNPKKSSYFANQLRIIKNLSR